MVEIVAEISCNHLGKLERALESIDVAASVGADAVKFQLWDKMIVGEHIIQGGPWAGYTMADLYLRAKTPAEWVPTLFDQARKSGIGCFFSVFDVESLAVLEANNCPRYKIASFELVDLPLIRAVAKTGKPMILSTGMADDEEIGLAAQACGSDLTLLHCVSAYPAKPGGLLQGMAELKYRHGWNCRIGLSDHSLGIGVSVAAVALGAVMIEKHFTLSAEGLDSAFSLQPDEFRLLVTECRRAWESLQEVGDQEAEHRMLRRSWYFSRDVPAGHVLTNEDVVTARPALGLLPTVDIIGQVTSKPVVYGQPVTAECLS